MYYHTSAISLFICTVISKHFHSLVVNTPPPNPCEHPVPTARSLMYRGFAARRARCWMPWVSGASQMLMIERAQKKPILTHVALSCSVFSIYLLPKEKYGHFSSCSEGTQRPKQGIWADAPGSSRHEMRGGCLSS